MNKRNTTIIGICCAAFFVAIALTGCNSDGTMKPTEIELNVGVIYNTIFLSVLGLLFSWANYASFRSFKHGESSDGSHEIPWILMCVAYIGVSGIFTVWSGFDMLMYRMSPYEAAVNIYDSMTYDTPLEERMKARGLNPFFDEVPEDLMPCSAPSPSSSSEPPSGSESNQSAMTPQELLNLAALSLP